MSAPEVSVVLAVRDDASLLLRLLVALARLPDKPAFEVVVADDGSAPPLADALTAIGGDLHVLRHERMVGLGAAADGAARASSGHTLVFLRPDAVPVDGWLDASLRALDGADAALPRAIRHDGTLELGPAPPCVVVKRGAFEAVGGFAGTAVPGRADVAGLLAGLRADGRSVVAVDDAQVLVMPPDA